MRKYIYIMMMMMFVPTILSAQNSDSLYVYQHSGPVDSLSMATVAGISHSRLNLKGEAQNDYVVMVVTFTNDDMRQYLLADIDSVVMVRDDLRIRLTRFIGSMGNRNGTRSQRRTSLDGDFMASTSEVDFFWEEGDHIYLEDGRRDTLAVISESKRTGDFYFGGDKLTADNITVYYAGQSPTTYNNVRVTKDQSQPTANTTEHIGVAGDCGTAVAQKQQDGSYLFHLDHHAAYLCFLPYIANDLKRTVLKSITVRSGGGLAGDFTLTTDGLTTKEGTDYEHAVTLTTGNFVLPRSADQNTSAYMVIAPQDGPTRLTCEFTVYDTELQSTGVYTKIVDLTKVESNMVYVVKANCNNYVVDLGLPVKFLNHNMGAMSPEEYGGYYAWGELEDKGNYTTGNYTFQSTTINNMPKNIRLTDNDVAHMRLGQNFSVPTSAELNMLIDSCTWTWNGNFNGKPGYVVSRHGNNLFMPAAGYRNGTSNNEFGSRGLYRTSQLTNSGKKQNWYLNFYSNSKTVGQSGEDIWLGESIRPVISTGVQMTDGSLVQVMTDSVQWRATELTAKLYATIYGYDKANDKTGIEVGFVVGKTDSVTIANGGTKVTASVSTDGAYNTDFVMPKDTAYYYRAYVKDADGNVNYANALQFGRAPIDLGLPSGTKWANISLGTTMPYQNGDPYAWGETQTKTTYPNDASNYRWYSHSTWIEPERLLDIQATDYDAASTKWGGVWMMPDRQDLQELIDNCDFISSTMDGVKGYTVKSRLNGDSLFIPLSGYFRTARNQYSEHGYMATSSLPGVNNQADHAAIFNNAGVNNWLRTDGVPVRPVYKTNAKDADGKPMFVRTLVAAKQYDGQTETDTLKATVRGLADATGATVGFSYSTDKKFASDTKVTVEKTTDGQFSYVFTPSTPGVTTYYRAFVCSNDTYYYGDTLKVDAVGLVDLGVSVLWANVDLGAASDDSHGDFYRWGANKPFLGDNSNYYTGNKDITPLSGHDTATEMWGSKFRMPTLQEFRELIDSCDVTTETSSNGVVGRRFTSKVKGYTGRSIFLPTSGVFQYNSSYRYAVGTENSHWTSTNYNNGRAYRVYLGNDTGADADKNYGFPVRPVQEKLGSLYGKGFVRTMADGAETDILKAYFHNVSGTAQTAGFLVGENRTLDKDNKLQQYDVTTVNGDFQQAITNLTPGKRYYYRAFAHDDNLWKYTPVDSFDVVGEVDLGLSVKWANVNIGSPSEASYGHYYQWGAKEPYYSHSAIQYYQGLKDITPESGYDTAAELWGGSWRMPSKEEWKELIDNCTWTWTNANGQFGMRVTGKKTGYTDRSIFIPAAGYYWDGTWRTDNSGSGDYWTSSFSSGVKAYYQSFWNNDKSSAPVDEVYFGFTVRPVSDNQVSVSSVDVLQSATDFTLASIECFAKGTPATATVGIRYGTSRDALNNDAPFATVGQRGRFAVTLTGLSAGASYYYVPYIRQDNSYIAKGDTLKFTTYELVDLDLPSGLLWMNLDLGADSICGNGDYYQWGATVPYPNSGWALYASEAQNLTESGRDAVRNTLGSPYRLATKAEMDELVSAAFWEWTTMNGVPGYKVSSKTNSERFIFLPTTGYLNGSGVLQNANTRGNYWTSSWNASGSAYDLGGGDATAHMGDDGNSYAPASYGSFLRPVLSVIGTYKAQPTGSAYLLRGQVNSVWGYGSSVTVGFVYSMSPSPAVNANGCTDVPVSVTQSGDYSYTFSNTGNNTTYYYKAYIYDGTKYYYGAEQSFTTMGANNYMAVDLGLPSGTKWANMNIGAESESDVGRFFAWGETQPKTNFSTATNELYHRSYYEAIGEDIAGTNYDAARAIMGGMWSMPTRDQFNELTDKNYTKWEWTTENGRNGYRITSLVEGYTDCSIFLPASGWMNGTSLSSDNSWGYFWLSTFYNNNEAYYSRFSNGSKGTDYDPRHEGFPIRGVINDGLTTATGTVGVVTAGVDWTIGAATATLRGNFGTQGTVSDVTYGFVVGNSTDIDATIADAAHILTSSNADAAGDYSMAYDYDGGVRYFRAFVKKGDHYAQGEVKSIGAPMLLDVAFAADGTAGNYAFTKQTCAKHGTPGISYNADYKRYEADLSANTFSGSAGHYYSIRFNYDDEFMARLMDGHTLEAVVKVPYLTSTAESDILANYENGGTGIGIHNKMFFAQAYTQGAYRSVYDPDDLDDKTGTYHHVVSVYDKGSAKLLLYVDGQLVSSEEAPGNHTITTTTAARYYMVGGNPNSSGNCATAWKGSIVFTRIYDDPLTAAQVQTLYNNLKK
ncbi:MAG: hypothetical protein II864_01485 [Prevotella sp.]|nr:hypothetical protein [Prevotella sp.]